MSIRYIKVPVPGPVHYVVKHVPVPVPTPPEVIRIYHHTEHEHHEHEHEHHFDCDAGYSNWYFGWSNSKKRLGESGFGDESSEPAGSRAPSEHPQK